MSDECLITQRSMVMMGRKGKSYQLDRKKLVNFINMQQFPFPVSKHNMFRAPLHLQILLYIIAYKKKNLLLQG